jgi:nucleoside diphosphate kinase
MQRREGSWTYMLVTPDGLLTGSLPWLLDKLRSVGLNPAAGRLIRVQSATMLSIYASPTQSRPEFLPADRAFDLWYGLSPGCVLLLHCNGNDACAVMSEAKGATNPSAASPDTIRYFGENGLMNLVHLARPSFMSAGSCWWRSLAIDGSSGTSRGHGVCNA